MRGHVEKLSKQLASALRVGPPRADGAALARLEAELLTHARAQETHEEELFAMEQKLRDRGEAITELEREVRRREGIVRELLASAELGVPAASEDENAELRRKLDALATTAAKQKSEIEAYRWRITELERPRDTDGDRLEPAPPASTPDRPAARTSADAEIDALRQALAQEHEARVRAENGEALRQARAQLEKQEVLLRQMTGERTS